VRNTGAHEQSVQQYYDANTRRFLWLGGSRESLAIHRAVWGPGVQDQAGALAYTNRLALAELRAVARPGRPVHVLDLGCGVGGTVFFLAQNFSGKAGAGDAFSASGITLSTVQAALAKKQASALGLADRCSFYTTSYLDLPLLPPAGLAVAIESFVLGPDPAGFFASAAAALYPGGRLVIVDDFLSERAAAGSLHPRQAEWTRVFQKGWRAPSLVTPARAGELAQAAGLLSRQALDLTPFLRLRSLRDRFVTLTLALGRILPLRSLLGASYWDSLTGGNALQHALRHGIFRYQMLVFERP
jgi:cyclopropane fatty-acyl-phospholipid synthase-like methyltransferase